MKSAWFVLSALVAGMLLGIGVEMASPSAATGSLPFIEPIGLLWLNALKMTIVPNSFAGKGETQKEAPEIPAEHKAFIAGLLQKHGVDDSDLSLPHAARSSLGDNMSDDGAARLLEVAFRHPIGLIANALGVPPPLMLELGKRHNVPVAALVGTRDHALAQVRAGVDILVVAGGEAGGHCGEVATMVLVPEVAAATERRRRRRRLSVAPAAPSSRRSAP